MATGREMGRKAGWDILPDRSAPANPLIIPPIMDGRKNEWTNYGARMTKNQWLFLPGG